MKAARYLLILLFLASVVVPNAGGMPLTAWGIGTGSSTVVVQNTSATEASVQADFINPSGWTDHTEVTSIPPRGSYEFDVADTPLSSNWVGSMILSSDKPLVALNNLIWTGGTKGDGTSAGTYTAFDEGDTTVYLPFLSTSKGQYSTFSIQNADRGSAHIYIKYIDREGNESASVEDDIPEGAQRTYDLRSPGGKVPYLGDTWWGAVVVSSSKNLVGVATVHWKECSGAYNGFASGDTTVYIPSIYRRQRDGAWKQSSNITVQNLSDSNPATVRLYFYGESGGPAILDFEDTIPANSSHAYNTKAGDNVPATTFEPLGTWHIGPVVIDSDQPIVAVALTKWWDEVFAGIYNSQTRGATELFVPDVARTKSGGGWDRNTAMVVQNLSPSDDATVHLYFYHRDGSLKLDFEDTIPASSCHEYNTRAGGSVPRSTFSPLGTDFLGSVYITSSQPVIGIVNSRWNREGMASQYNIF